MAGACPRASSGWPFGAAIRLRRLHYPHRRQRRVRFRLRPPHRQRRARRRSIRSTREIVSLTARIRGRASNCCSTPRSSGEAPCAAACSRPTASRPPDIPVAPDARVRPRPLGFRPGRTRSANSSFADAPVGVFTLSAAEDVRRVRAVTGVLARGGQTTEIDVVLVARAGRRRAARRTRVPERRRDARRGIHGLRRLLRPRQRSASKPSTRHSRRDRHFAFARTLPPADTTSWRSSRRPSNSA